ncbi:unnamed protein product [Ceratitis capitata]|uniref:Delta-like protein n=1 Tax=Ceratitis capitata TaxID=7213 RepID=A0A811UAD9_CERCA|nr:unnamed protein product [Ceratitis capitata]
MGLLIQRLSLQQVLEVSPEWKTNKSEAQYTWLEYDFRVTCDPHYYGAGCANLCRPRDDPFGHYTCSDGGEIICLTGWQGDYCDKEAAIVASSTTTVQPSLYALRIQPFVSS